VATQDAPKRHQPAAKLHFSRRLQRFTALAKVRITVVNGMIQRGTFACRVLSWAAARGGECPLSRLAHYFVTACIAVVSICVALALYAAQDFALLPSAVVGGGAFAEKLVAHEREVMAAPKDLPFTTAAAIPEAFLTAWDAMMVQGGLAGAQHVLIHAVASGVGTAGCQLAAAYGANVVGTSRTADKLER